ncbi:MAG TPA: sulfatase-like hydrolase/transferase, partial [Thermoanaerobaculia bacterium]|nr:sulfatase-like hydrolase/transferase [Thermoanaerobaculia bacterium]
MAILALLVAASGCSRPSERAADREARATPIGDLRGRVFAAQEEWIVPGPSWTAAANGVWATEADEASIEVLRLRDGGGPLRFVLGLPESAGLRASWDGVELEAVVGIGGRRTVEVPAEALGAGLHALRLRPVPQLAPPVPLTWLTHDGPGREVDRRMPSRHLMTRFLDLGLTGLGATLHDGFVTLGRWRTAIDLGEDGGGTLCAFLENASQRPGTVLARVVGGSGPGLRLELAAGARGLLRLDVPAGRRVVEVDLETPRALEAWVWGGPFFVPARPRVPTLVLVTLDTTRRDAIGLFGAGAASTPNLDRFASRATQFPRASSTTSWTLPSHASIFTGLYPIEHGAGVGRPALDRRFDTLAEHLARRYVTVGLVGGALLRHRFGVGQGFGLYRVPRDAAVPGRILTDEALELLEELDGLPVFLFVNLFDAHYPYLPAGASERSARFEAALARIPAGSPWRSIVLGEGEVWKRLRDGGIPPDPAGIEALRAAYAEGVAEVDRQLGRLLASLERHGRLDDALVAVVSDHGELLGSKGLFFHSARLDPALVDVPLVVRFPGEREGRSVDLPVGLVDLFPTFLEASGIAPPPSRGLQLLDLEAIRRRPALWFEETET